MTAKACLLSFVLFAGGRTPVCAQKLLYDSALALQQMAVLKQTSPRGEHIPELIYACEVAAEHQDADTLVLALKGKPHPNLCGRALELLGTLPVQLQKTAFAQLLRDDEFWPTQIANPHSMAEINRQQQARSLISRLLGRDLRILSKDYDPDLLRQLRNEAADFNPRLLSRDEREQLNKELLAS